MKILRKLLAIAILLMLGFGIYLAVKGFSGYDPLALDANQFIGVVTDRGIEVLSGMGLKGLPQRSAAIRASESTGKIERLVTYVLVADTHNDNQHLQKALAQAKTYQPMFVIGLGDYTDVGTVAELEQAKVQFEAAGLPYYTIPGDHDFWDNKNKGEQATANYEQVFGQPYQSFETQGVTHILVNNANLDAGLSDEQFRWLEATLASASTTRANRPIFLYFHQPIYHPTTSHIMGRINPELAGQRDRLEALAKHYRVSEIINGDIHFFSQYTERSTQLSMTTIGAVTDQRNPQRPRFAIVTVYTDGSYKITDVEIK